MPEPLHPPYNIVQPRVLNRWLDVNAQNGPLTRARYNLVIPAFNLYSPNNGYSNICGAFDFIASNTFSIADLSGLPSNPNYTMFVSYLDPTYESSVDTGVTYITYDVKRYLLVKGNLEDVRIGYEVYTNQLIKPIFRVEVWTISTSYAVQATAITLPTSVLIPIDYRFGSDNTLVSPSRSLTVNAFPSTNMNLPLAFPTHSTPNVS